jgi:hypothetical protein
MAAALASRRIPLAFAHIGHFGCAAFLTLSSQTGRQLRNIQFSIFEPEVPSRGRITDAAT